ncbi:MAG: hypothetical protein RR048_05085 [Oscillospiraceae bacterium]
MTDIVISSDLGENGLKYHCHISVWNMVKNKYEINVLKIFPIIIIGRFSVLTETQHNNHKQTTIIP